MGVHSAPTLLRNAIVSGRPAVVGTYHHSAIRTEGLGHRFGRHRVFGDLSFEVRWGTATALLGPNGVGKTTLMRILGGALTPSQGKIWLDNKPLWGDGDAARKTCVLLCGSAFVYDDLRGTENLRFALEMAGIGSSPERVRGTLARVGLPPDLAAPVRSYSTGMRKRLAIARLWVVRSRILLLDEPYASLDDEGRSVVDGMIHEHLDSGGAVLLASHDRARARNICDDLVELPKRPPGPAVTSLELSVPRSRQ